MEVDHKVEAELPGEVQGDEEDQADMRPELIHLASRVKRRQGKAKAPVMQRRLLGVEEVADLLAISPKTIYNQVGRKSKRQFPVKAKRVGRLVKFAVEDVENFIQKL